MARPIHANADATRHHILRAAQGMFADRGLEGTPLREVAREAGVTMSTVHHYFGSKAGLYDACNRAYLDQLLELKDQVAGSLAGARSLGHTVQLAVEQAWSFVREHRSMVRLMLRNVVATGQTLAPTREESLRPMLDQGASLLAPMLGRPVVGVRLALTSIMYLIARFGLNSDEELGLILGLDDGDPATVHREVEAYLVRAAHALLGITG